MADLRVSHVTQVAVPTGTVLHRGPVSSHRPHSVMARSPFPTERPFIEAGPRTTARGSRWTAVAVPDGTALHRGSADHAFDISAH